MASPITFSGFNQIDFGMILRSVMEQERAPVRALETQQRDLKERASTFSQLATRLNALRTAAEALRKPELAGRASSNSDPATVKVTTSSASAVGVYDIVVDRLARAQVTASTSTYAGRDTVVATGGSLMIGDTEFAIDGETTLEQLVTRINNTEGVAARAAIISPSPGAFTLVLTGRHTGEANAFAVSSTLSGGAGAAFAGHAVDATDALVRINNIEILSSTNSLDMAVPGSKIDLLRAGSSTVSVTPNADSAKNAIKELVKAYNDVLKFMDDQNLASIRGDAGSIGRESLLRTLRGQLRSLALSEGPGGALSAAGIEFDRSGKLTFAEAKFDTFTGGELGTLGALFGDRTAGSGPMALMSEAIDRYTGTGGILGSTRQRLDEQSKALAARIRHFEERLAIRRDALQQEFIAADRVMTQLNAQMSSLSSLGGQYQLF